MADENFKIGDVVRLKSRGPLMTITFFHDDGDAMCTWFKDEQLCQAFIPPDALDKAKN